ncbi:MAG: hypothetical protein K8R59_03115 [Thermoanaerobaculales bacterium]|nr:hypothetical protein [Thermoanaerobaculales bacterium]
MLEDAFARQPGLIQAAVFRARALQALGRTDEALAALHELAPNQPGAWLQIARLELDRGNRREARAALNEALAAGGERARAAAEKDPVLSGLL